MKFDKLDYIVAFALLFVPLFCCIILSDIIPVAPDFEVAP